MSASESRLRRALRKPPRVLARRLLDESLREVERFRAPQRGRLAEEDLLRHTQAESIDALWARVVRRAPFRLDGPPRLEDGERKRLLAAADAALERRVRLLGFETVLGMPIDWLRDPVTGDLWERGYAPRLRYVDAERPSDVKRVWEISRLQWLLPAAQAFVLTGDDRYAAGVREILDEWIAANPYAGTVNWSVTMEVALRVLTWSWLLGALGESPAWNDDAFRFRFLRALWLHGDYTMRHLERSEINGNHYDANACGLVFAGLLFDNRWADDGWRALEDELPKQVTSDGVDFEASASYHRLVCELFLLPALYRRELGLPVPAGYWARLEAMGRFTATSLHPDGEAPLWGDADDARALPLGEGDVNDHRQLAGTLGLGGDLRDARWLFATTREAPPPRRRSAEFPLGGVFVLASEVDHVFIDCGPVGLAGRGGHGHNDCLSFEATLDGRRVVTDSGSYVYTASAVERNRFRATAAHNTPRVDGAEQNRIPESLWNLEDDARPELLLFEPLRFRGAHTGYLRLADPVRPVRTIALEPSLHALVVHDAFEAAGDHEIEVPYHLAPGLEPRAAAEGALALDDDFVLRWRGEWSCSLERSWLSPSYGVRVERSKVVFRRKGQAEPLLVTIAPAAVRESELFAWAERCAE